MKEKIKTNVYHFLMIYFIPAMLGVVTYRSLKFDIITFFCILTLDVAYIVFLKILSSALNDIKKTFEGIKDEYSRLLEQYNILLTAQYKIRKIFTEFLKSKKEN